MIAPLFVGMIADPFFAAQRLLGLLHLAGAGIMYGATTLMLGDSPSPNAINVVFFGYMLTYFPTLSLTNTVAMRSMVGQFLRSITERAMPHHPAVSKRILHNAPHQITQLALRILRNL